MNTKQATEYWVIPPEANAEFVAHMENVLATYEKAYDPTQPVVCMDEQPVQLINETRQPIPETTDHPKRIDYEYQRNGTASIFMFCEPLGEWRQATAREHRTKFDWAHEVASLLDRRYADCDQITLVCDNLNTHTPSEHFTRPLNQNEHVNTFVASTSVSRPSTEAGSTSLKTNLAV